MDNFNIVVLFAVLLFARLGIRLYTKYQELKKETDKDTSK